MPNYNKLEYGQKIYADLGQDISTATTITFILQPKIGRKLEKTIGVSVGTVNVNVNDETYLANQYIQYTIEAGDLTYAGLWHKKGKAKLSATNEIISDYTMFTVME